MINGLFSVETHIAGEEQVERARVPRICVLKKNVAHTSGEKRGVFNVR